MTTAEAKSRCEMLLVAGPAQCQGRSKMGSESGYILKIEPKGFSGPPYMKCE